MSNTVPKEFAADVRGHYEELPYPYRDPAIEGQFFYAADGFNADAVNHYAWGGKKDLRQGGRILIAGDGTGDASITWAETLIGSTAEIVAIDLSETSINLAKTRLAKRQLTSVTHHHMSILDLPKSELGKFDVIECSGVLHHLTDPNEGLAALAAMLKDDGIIEIMVYAQYGRLSVYMVQDLLRRLMKPDMTRAEKIKLARGFLDNVPTTHWLTVKNEMFLEDMRWEDGSGIYDLLLHTVDRAYTVPQLYEWAEGAGLQLTALFSDHTDESLYTPENYTNNPAVLEGLKGKSDREKFAIGELMHGSIAKHNLFMTKEPKTQAALEEDMVIVYGLLQSMFTGYVMDLVAMLSMAAIGERVTLHARPFPFSPPLIVTKRPSTELLVKMIDGKRTVGEIVAETSRLGKFSRNDVTKDLQLLYKELRARLMVFLRHKSVPPYITGPQIGERLKKIGLPA